MPHCAFLSACCLLQGADNLRSIPNYGWMLQDCCSLSNPHWGNWPSNIANPKDYRLWTCAETVCTLHHMIKHFTNKLAWHQFRTKFGLAQTATQVQVLE